MKANAIVCRCSGAYDDHKRFNSIVDEIFESKQKSDKWARTTVVLHNKQIVATGGNLKEEFWFINASIKSNTHIITMDDKGELVKNDPEKIALLSTYLSHAERHTGSAQGRNKFDGTQFGM